MIAKQAISVLHFFGFSGHGLPGMAKSLPVACKQLRQQLMRGHRHSPEKWTGFVIY